MSGEEPVDDTYTESQVIMTAVKIIAPFTLTYGLFLAFHGGDTPGGSFQGGAVIGVTILMIAFAFGIEPTRQWLQNRVIVGLVTGGVVVFVFVGLAAILLGGNFLEYDRFYDALGIRQKWGMEAIEIGGIALIVAGVVVTLFFATAAGFPPTVREGAGREEERPRRADGGRTGVGGRVAKRGDRVDERGVRGVEHGDGIDENGERIDENGAHTCDLASAGDGVTADDGGGGGR